MSGEELLNPAAEDSTGLIEDDNELCHESSLPGVVLKG